TVRRPGRKMRNEEVKTGRRRTNTSNFRVRRSSCRRVSCAGPSALPIADVLATQNPFLTADHDRPYAEHSPECPDRPRADDGKVRKRRTDRTHHRTRRRASHGGWWSRSDPSY